MKRETLMSSFLELKCSKKLLNSTVILPTLWLYLETYFNSQTYMLGLVLSAFSLSSLICAPFFGSISDKTGNTKVILLFANVFSCVGSLMYTLGISDWFLVGSRLVAGVGAGIGAALMGDIAKTTSIAERTSVLSLFMAVRQFGLLAGPGFNLFLRELNFSIGPITVDKYTSPGIFMAGLWILHEVSVLFCFWNLPSLQKEQEKEIIKENVQYPATASASSVNSNPEDHSGLLFEQTNSNFPTDSNNVGNSNSAISSDISDLTTEPRLATFAVGSAPLDLPPERSNISASSEVIITAEQYMSTSPGHLQYPELLTKDTRTNDKKPVISNPQNVPVNEIDNRNTTPIIPTHRVCSPTANEESFEGHINEYQTQELHSPVEQIKSGHQVKKAKVIINKKYLYDEFIREEVVVILATIFTAFFGQLVLETACTPLTKKLLNWGEIENSLLYCGAGLEILLVFILISWLSKRFHDRYLLLLGYVLMVITLTFLTAFVPASKPGEYTKNLIGLITGIMLDIFSIPFLAVIGTSLYSKITHPETQGLSQGIRRSVTGLATIFGPIWAGGMQNYLYAMFGVCLGLSVLVMIMLLLSFKHLKERVPEPITLTEEQPSIEQSHEEDDRPLLAEA